MAETDDKGETKKSSGNGKLPVFHYNHPMPCDFCGAMTRGEIVEGEIQCDACHTALF